LYDNVVEDLQEFHDTSVDFIDHDNPFDQYEEYRFRTVATHSTIPEEAFVDAVMYTDFSDIVDDVIENVHLAVVNSVYDLNLTDDAKVKPDFALLRSLFGWASADTMKKTFDVTTQYARGRVSDTLKQHWCSRFLHATSREETKLMPLTQRLVIHLLSTAVLQKHKSLLDVRLWLRMYMA
jgi:hypothetical protein